MPVCHDIRTRETDTIGISCNMYGVVFCVLPLTVTYNFLMTYSAAKLSKSGTLFTLFKALPFFF
jgi:hypothetical protein